MKRASLLRLFSVMLFVCLAAGGLSLSVGCGPQCTSPKGKWKATWTLTSGSCPTPPLPVIDFGDGVKNDTSEECQTVFDTKACQVKISCRSSADDEGVETVMEGALDIKGPNLAEGSVKMTLTNQSGESMTCTFGVVVKP